MTRARLAGTSLFGATFGGADLSGARLFGANLSVARNLTQQQLNSARGDDRTKLPDGRQQPAHWLSRPAYRPPRPMYQPPRSADW